MGCLGHFNGTDVLEAGKAGDERKGGKKMFGYELIDSIKLDNLYKENNRLRVALAEEKEHTHEILNKRGESVDAMVKALAEESKFANEYSRRLLSSEEARRSLGEKNKQYAEENARLKERIEVLEGQLKYEQECYKSLKESYAKVLEYAPSDARSQLVEVV